jgi:hypothetical protein
MVVQTVWLLPDGNVDSRRGLLLVVFFEGVMKSMASSNSSAIRKCLMGPGEFIALHLGVVQGRVNPVLRLRMQYEIIVIFLYVVLAVF